ncbi:hypothetical protein O9G_000153 [Rozella allomycis CSF55]|uniref:Uncharacterized protein n=1 Tax=Rozella allomycis (strain CSF55) TaxID=988480 RepID=A0A075AP19_ROZAC|nr:hypothetical protein O9G_000153 [Rozella allomycis CSF55]|eukprot:EPZ31674.1 hypothetical protein O9G_000153 [Rozella allomycis CSF55]
MAMTKFEVYLLYGVKGGFVQPLYHRCVYFRLRNDEIEVTEKSLISPRNDLFNKVYKVKKSVFAMDKAMIDKFKNYVTDKDNALVVSIENDGYALEWSNLPTYTGCNQNERTDVKNEFVDQYDNLVSLIESLTQNSVKEEYVENEEYPFDISILHNESGEMVE